MNKRLVTRLAAGAALLLLILLVACGGSAANGAAETAATAVVPAATVAASAATTAVPTEAAAPTEQPAAAEEPAATAEPAQPKAALTKLNLNTASGDDYLAAIPNFSSRMVREFLEYRPYVSILQFRQDIGKYVDEAQVAEWEQYVYVPVDANNSDEATLMQLPGVDETIASALIAGRPYADNAAFLAALGNQVSADDAAAASAYLAQ